jgi:hypothetical protein
MSPTCKLSAVAFCLDFGLNRLETKLVALFDRFSPDKLTPLLDLFMLAAPPARFAPLSDLRKFPLADTRLAPLGVLRSLPAVSGLRSKLDAREAREASACDITSFKDVAAIS